MDYSSDEPLRVAEDGELVGMLGHVARAFSMTRRAVLRCLHTHAPEAIILSAGEGLDRLLIMDADAVQALRDYAESKTVALRLPDAASVAR